MTDILDELDHAAGSDTCSPWMTGIIRKAAHEIARLRVKNGELNRRSQKAAAAARDTYVEAQSHGVSAGRILANHAAGMWRDLALAMTDYLNHLPACMAHPKFSGDESLCDCNLQVISAALNRMLAEEESLTDEADRARERLKAHHSEKGTPSHSLPEMNIHAPMPPVNPPRKPMTKEELASAMHKVFQGSNDAAPWDSLSHDWQQRWLSAAEDAIGAIGNDQ